jgi:DNA anti-recombination protein RmuC
MAEQPENVVLEHLRYIRTRIDRVADDVGELRDRIVAVEQHVSAIEQHLTTVSIDIGKLIDTG